MNTTAKDGLRSLTMTQKKIYFRNRSRGLVNMNLFVKTKNNVLGLTICKGSPSSFTSVSSGQACQKNDLKEKDHCDQAALVLQDRKSTRLNSSHVRISYAVFCLKKKKKKKNK